MTTQPGDEGDTSIEGEAVTDHISTSAHFDAEELAVEGSLRPSALREFIGQRKVVDQLKLLLEAASIEQRTPDHILLAGPPGLGKTTLAMIVAHESNRSLRISSGPAITHAGDLAALLSSLEEGEVLFIDEIHRMARSAEEMLYLAMEDFRIDVMVGKGVGASSIRLDLPAFTLVGATTRTGLLANPLRDRFGFTAHLEYYSTDELDDVVARTAKLMDVHLTPDALNAIARRSRGTPRIANRLVRRARDYLVVHPEVAAVDAVTQSLALYDVDERGLDRLDREVLTALITRFNGGPVGISSLAVAIGEDTETIESIVEPFLIREGFLTRTSRGRVATEEAWRHLSISQPAKD